MKKRLCWSVVLLCLPAILPTPIAAQTQGVPQELQQLADEIAQLREALAQGVTAKPDRYYLTNDEFDGAHALNACTEGFHMASLWEIFDTTELKYDTALGLTRPDSGQGPPSGVEGWIRTGVGSEVFVFPDQPTNCGVWTLAPPPQSGLFGSVVRLTQTWVPFAINDPTFPQFRPVAAEITPWAGAARHCATALPVWCVQDR